MKLTFHLLLIFSLVFVSCRKQASNNPASNPTTYNVRPSPKPSGPSPASVRPVPRPVSPSPVGPSPSPVGPAPSPVSPAPVSPGPSPVTPSPVSPDSSPIGPMPDMDSNSSSGLDNSSVPAGPDSNQTTIDPSSAGGADQSADQSSDQDASSNSGEDNSSSDNSSQNSSSENSNSSDNSSSSPDNNSRSAPSSSANVGELLSDPPADMCPQTQENRKTVDLRSEIGDARHQDGMGWCYAFAASELLTQYLQRTKGSVLNPPQNIDFTKDKNMVSAASVVANYLNIETKYYRNMMKNPTLDYHRRPERVNIGNGYVSNAQYYTAGMPGDAMIRTGNADKNFPDVKFCLEKDFNSEVYMQRGDQSDYDYCNDRGSLGEWVSKTDSIVNEVNRIKNSPQMSAGKCSLQFAPGGAPSVRGMCVENPAYRLGGPAVSFCNSDIPKSNYVSQKQLVDQMNKDLEEGRIIQVNYNNSNLRKPNMKSLPREPATHSTTVVGRQINKETCQVEYMVRDSQMLTCGSHKYSLQSNPRLGETLRCEKTPGKRGVTLFVNESFFKKHLVSTYVIQNMKL